MHVPFFKFPITNMLLLFSSDIYFIGGFGTVAWVDVKEYEAIQPDKIAVDGGEQNLKVNYCEIFLTKKKRTKQLNPHF